MNLRTLFEPRRLAVALAAVCAFLELYVTQAMLPVLRVEFHAGVQAVALTVMAPTLAVALAAPLAGAISQRYGRRPVLLLSASLLGATTLGAATATSLTALIAWRFAEGLFIPGIFTSAVAYIAEEWPGCETPAVTAVFTAGAVLGSFVGRYLGGALTQFYGWSTAFGTLGVLSLLLVAALTRVLAPQRNFAAGGDWRSSLLGLVKIAGNRRLLATCAIGFGTLFCQVATFTYVSFHLAAAPYRLNAHQLGEVVAVFLVGMVATPFAGRLAQRHGTLRLLRSGLLIGAAGMLLTLARPLPVILAGLTLLAASTFIAQSMSTAVVPKLVPAARSAAVGLYVLSYYLGGSLGAQLPGMLWDRFGWNGCVALVVFTQALVAVIAGFAWRPQDRYTADAPRHAAARAT